MYRSCTGQELQSHVINSFHIFACSRPLDGPRILTCKGIILVVPDEEFDYLVATLIHSSGNASWIGPPQGILDYVPQVRNCFNMYELFDRRALIYLLYNDDIPFFLTKCFLPSHI